MFKAFILSLIAGLSSITGYFLTYLKLNKEQENKIIVICLTISMIVLLYISIFDLIPNGFIYNRPFLSLILIVSGVGGVITLKDKNNDNNLFKLGIISALTLMLHNIPEGIITMISNIANKSIGMKMTIGILIHNIPEGIIIALPIYYSTKSRLKSFVYTFIAGISEPIGGLLFYILFKDNITDTLIKYFLLIVGGMMISLVINKILNKCLAYQDNKSMRIGIVVGLIIITLMFIFI